MRCAVALCKTDNRSKSFYKDTRFFRFPVNINTQKTWINSCKRKDKFNVKNARVCSKHFSAESYERDLKYELCNLYSSRNQKVLKPDAVPLLNLPNTTDKPSPYSLKINQRKERLSKRNQSKLVKEILLKK